MRKMGKSIHQIWVRHVKGFTIISGSDDNTISVWDEKCRTVAALERCVLNTGSFACKIVRGEVQLAVERRSTLNTGGRNHKLDCTYLLVVQM